MSKKSGFKKLFTFIIALMMTLSPVFLSGCFGNTTISNNTSNSQQTNSTLPSGGGGGGSVPNNNQNNIQRDDDRPSLEYEEYDQYFKNYRVTYQTDKNSRDGFNNNITSQNATASQNIISGLISKYGSEADDVFSKAKNNIQTENEKSILGLENDYYDKPLNYPYEEDKNDFSVYKHKNSLTDENLNQKTKNLILGITLILAGYRVEDDNFGSTYNSYSSNINAYIDSEFKLIPGTELSNLVNTISHLGFTDLETEQIESFVCKYIIGETLINDDNSKFVNGYFFHNGIGYEFQQLTGNDAQKYNRFLNDETFAMRDYLDKITDSEIKNYIYVINEYTTRYLGLVSNQPSSNLFNFSMEGRLSTASLITDESDTYIATDGYEQKQITKAIYDNFINLTGTGFNTNFWGYNESGVIDKSLEGVGFAKDSAGHNLVSIRLPYFKNYVNNVHTIVNNELGAEADPTSTEYATWQLIYGVPYPYTEKYPNIPYTYFADYDNGDMLFDGESGAARMFSGFKLYQNLVLMPQSDVDVESGALFVVRQLVEDETHYPDGSTDHSGDFEMTVYVRYYDAATQSYATWTDAETNETTQFYKIGTETIDYNMYITEDIDEEALENAETDEDIENAKSFKANYAPVTFDFSIKDILLSAQINGQDNDSWTLEAFDDGRELSLHNQELVTKYNYGECFKEDYTPEGDKVVVYDGKSVGSSSYFELVFSCSRAVPFQFCFYPTVAYAPQS